MILLVCGGRDYEDRARVFHALCVLSERHQITRVIHGACQDKHGKLRGADRWADEWARESGIEVVPYPANFREYGPRGGPMRNQRMLEHGKPDAAVAFPGGDGTADMCRRLERYGVSIWRPYG